MPLGSMKQLQIVAGRIYNLLKKEAAYGPNTQHLVDFRAAQKLERASILGLVMARPLKVTLLSRSRGARGGRLVECPPSALAL
jgi:hypothetical protein